MSEPSEPSEQVDHGQQADRARPYHLLITGVFQVEVPLTLRNSRRELEKQVIEECANVLKSSFPGKLGNSGVIVPHVTHVEITHAMEIAR